MVCNHLGSREPTRSSACRQTDFVEDEVEITESVPESQLPTINKILKTFVSNRTKSYTKLLEECQEGRFDTHHTTYVVRPRRAILPYVVGHTLSRFCTVAASSGVLGPTHWTVNDTFAALLSHSCVCSKVFTAGLHFDSAFLLCCSLPQEQPMGDSFRSFLSVWSCTLPGASCAASRVMFQSLQSALCKVDEGFSS